MTTEKLKALEPLFGSWYVESKLGQGKNSAFFRVSRNENGLVRRMGIKTVRFPENDREISRVIASGKYQTVGEYLDYLEKTVRHNLQKMLSLRGNPNVIRFDAFDIIKENSCFYAVILMEQLTPLSEVFKADTVPPVQAVNLAVDIANALEGFRSQGVIHGEVRPDNIYADSEGRFKLGDFGLSEREYTSDAPDISSYTAPEIHLGRGKSDTSDIYSLGLLMYKLLNHNRMPFSPAYPTPLSLTDREQAFEKRIRGETFTKPAKSDVNLSRIILKACAYSPYDRYTTPQLLKSELQKYLQMMAAATAPVQSVPDAAPSFTQARAVPKAPPMDYELSPDDVVFSDYENKEEAEPTAEAEEYEDDITNDEVIEEEESSKKMYFIVAALVVVLALVVALIIKATGDKKEPSTLPTISTTYPTTAPTVPSSEETTEETTEATTEETTTSPSTEPEPSTEPTLVTTSKKDGDKASEGRVYKDISDYRIIQKPEDVYFDDVIFDLAGRLGDNVEGGGKAYVYQMSGASVLQKVPAQISCVDDGETVTCFVTVEDEDFYYEGATYQYYICLEEGAIQSEDIVSLPLQIKI